jgi:hypothetical protein
MASLSNINGLFDVHSTGAILFSDEHGTTGQILRSNGDAAPTWINFNSTGFGGDYLPLAGGTLTGATATATGISFTVGGTLTVNGSGGSVFNSTATSNHIIAAYRATNGNNVATFRTTDSGYIFRIHAQNAGTIYIQNDDGSNYLKIPDNGNNEVLGNTIFGGNVAIGPDALDIQIKAASNNSGNNLIYMRGNASNDKSSLQINHFGYADYYIGVGHVGNGKFNIANDLTGNDFVIDTSGNVGIGTTGPTAKLQIGLNPDPSQTAESLVHLLSSTTSSTVNGFTHLKLDYTSGASPGTAGAQIMFNQGYHPANPDYTQPVGSIRGWKTGADYNYGGGLQLLYQPDAGALGLLVGMTLTGGGDVGIGTDSPSSKLVVRTSTDHNFEVEETGGELRLSALNNARSANIGLQFAASEFNFLTGNVGIGTTVTDEAKLIVEASTEIPTGGWYNEFGNLHVTTDTQGINNGGTISMGGLGRTAGPTEYFRYAQISGRAESGSNGSPQGYMAFETTSGVTNITTERMRIDSSGTVDVKANSNNVNGMAAIIARLGSNCDNTTSYAFIAETGTANRCFIHGNGNIVNTNDSYGALSDERLKENIIDATPKLDDLMKVKVRNFNLIGEKTKQIGVVAQELEEVFPNMIDETKGLNPDDETLYKSVKYSVFVPMLIKAIQELEARVKELENK